MFSFWVSARVAYFAHELYRRLTDEDPNIKPKLHLVESTNCGKYISLMVQCEVEAEPKLNGVCNTIVDFTKRIQFPFNPFIVVVLCGTRKGTVTIPYTE